MFGCHTQSSCLVRSSSNIVAGSTASQNPVSFYNESFSVFPTVPLINVGVSGYTALGTSFDVGFYGYNPGNFGNTNGLFTLGSSGYYSNNVSLGFGDTGNTSLNFLSIQLYNVTGSTLVYNETYPVLDSNTRYYKLNFDSFLQQGSYQYQVNYTNANANSNIVGGNISFKNLNDPQLPY